MRLSSFLLGILLLGGSWPGAGQSLGEVAEREKERRQRLRQGESRAYDDWDLRRRGSPPIPSAPTPPADAGGDEGANAESGGEPEEVDPTETPSYWRDRKSAIDRRISEIQGELNRPGFGTDPTNLIRRRRLERDLAQARSELEELRAEARRKGVPPGWLR